MITPIRDLITERTILPRLPWLLIADLVGLSIAIYLVVLQIDYEALEFSKRLFLLLLGAFSLNARFLLNQFKSIETLLRKQRPLMLLAPTLAAVTTLIMQAASRSYYSGRALLIFIIFWTLWMFAIRLFVKRYKSNLSLLIIHPASFDSELKDLSNVKLSYLDTPPTSFKDHNIVMIDPAATYSREWLQWLAHADMYGIRTLSAPLVIETLTRRIPINMLHGVWAFEILAGRSNYHFWKRLFDVLAVILLSPFLFILGLAVSLLIASDRSGPVFFWQERVGKNGKPFRMVKFRTMRADSEEDGAAFAQVDDPRIIPMGKFLRKTRIDEIPQFWNVFRGEMSIIGPRPEQTTFADFYEKEIPLYELRHNVRPGITGWAQVMHGYTASTDETKDKLCYDFYYVKHVSPELDLRIVYQTFHTVLSFFGAR